MPELVVVTDIAYRSYLRPANVSTVGREPDLALAEIARKVSGIRLRREIKIPTARDGFVACEPIYRVEELWLLQQAV